MLPPWNDMVWSWLLRGVAFGFVGGLALILLFLLTYKYSGLVTLHPSGLVYFLVGVEIGVALVGRSLSRALKPLPRRGNASSTSKIFHPGTEKYHLIRLTTARLNSAPMNPGSPAP
jgi:hypothetical protein